MAENSAQPPAPTETPEAMYLGGEIGADDMDLVSLPGDNQSQDNQPEENQPENEPAGDSGDQESEEDKKQAAADKKEEELRAKRQAEYDEALRASPDVEDVGKKFKAPEPLEKRVNLDEAEPDEIKQASADEREEASERDERIRQTAEYGRQLDVDAKKVMSVYPQLDPDSRDYNKELHESVMDFYDQFKREIFDGESKQPYGGNSLFDMVDFAMKNREAAFNEGLEKGRQEGIEAQKTSQVKADSAPQGESSAQQPKDDRTDMQKAMDEAFNEGMGGDLVMLDA